MKDVIIGGVHPLNNKNLGGEVENETENNDINTTLAASLVSELCVCVSAASYGGHLVVELWQGGV